MLLCHYKFTDKLFTGYKLCRYRYHRNTGSFSRHSNPWLCQVEGNNQTKDEVLCPLKEVWTLLDVSRLLPLNKLIWLQMESSIFSSPHYSGQNENQLVLEQLMVATADQGLGAGWVKFHFWIPLSVMVSQLDMRLRSSFAENISARKSVYPNQPV